jgi:hypothetical protein
MPKPCHTQFKKQVGCTHMYATIHTWGDVINGKQYIRAKYQSITLYYIFNIQNKSYNHDLSVWTKDITKTEIKSASVLPPLTTDTAGNSTEEGCSLSIGTIILIELQIILSWTTSQARVSTREYSANRWKMTCKAWTKESLTWLSALLYLKVCLNY